MMAIKFTVLKLALHFFFLQGLGSLALQTTSNPVRKVVTMLQAMHKKITQEGDKETELHDKFVCYCRTYSDVKLQEAIVADKTKIDELTSAIKAAKGHLTQLSADLTKAKEEMASAKATIADATALREKDAAAFSKQSSEDKANIAAIEKAIAAIKKGSGMEMLQTNTVQQLQKLVSKQDADEEDKRQVAAFLSHEDSSPSSDAVVGILSNMLDVMKKSLADATAAEQDAIAEYQQLMAAKEKEVDVLMNAIEKKTEREGDLSMDYVDMTSGLEDTKVSLKENEKMVVEMKKACASHDEVYELNKKMRAEELVAISDTIKILNDDDALDLFKKTLPKKGDSFLQVKVNLRFMREHALSELQLARSHASFTSRPALDFLVLALRGRKIGLEGILKMIDEMAMTLQNEQHGDTKKKDFCAAEFDSSEDKKKQLERSISDLETAVEDNKEGIASLKEEMDTLEQGIKDLDQSVKEATGQRKQEHEEYTQEMSDDAAAKEILGFAKNRLNKFYNPKLYIPPPKRELSAEDHIMAGLGGETFMQVNSHVYGTGDPPPPPGAMHAFKDKVAQSTGVIEMIDLLISDLNRAMAEHEAEEKSAQEDYETTMADAAAKRTADSKSLDEKDAAVADMESQLQKHHDDHKSSEKDHAATLKYIHSLHQDCDWLLKYYSVRKEARASEIDALQKAKAILNGAEFSLTQLYTNRFVRLRS